MDMTEALDLHLDLADYRREVAALYAQVRAHHDPEAARRPFNLRPPLPAELLPVLERRPDGDRIEVPQHPPLAAVQPLRGGSPPVDDQ